MLAAMMQATAAATVVRTRRWRRSLRPARRELPTRRPIGGSPDTARSIWARSDGSSIAVLPRCVWLSARVVGAGLGGYAVEQQAQLVESPGALALDIAGRAAEQRSG